MKSDSCAIAVVPSRLADLSALVKPRIAVLVLFTVAAGALLAQRGTPDLAQLIHTLIGVALTASSANILNQPLERHTDGLMRRTENRPLPTGRMSPAEVLVLGLTLGVAGLAYQAMTLRQPLAVVLNGVTLVSYVAIYTPLKRWTTLNTLVGAVPGALPPLIGWASVTGSLDHEAMALFLILFLWQVPHFLAIAWIYRADYTRAGLQMLPVVDPEGKRTARQMVCYAWTLLLVSLWPMLAGHAGPFYAVGAVLLGGYFVAAAWGFVRDRSTDQARSVLHASLVYLPALLALMLLGNWL